MPNENKPRFLIIETSSRWGQVAVAQGETLLQCRPLDEARRHARDLAPAVRGLLAEQQWQPGEIAAVLVSRGPGSYTGLRVGIMSAKTFAYVTGCALLAIDTLAASAHQVPADVLRVDVFADAQQDRVYVQQFQRPAGASDFAAATELAIRPFADWLADEHKAPWVTGDGLRGKEARLPPEVQLVPPEFWPPQPDSLLYLGRQRFERGERDDFWTLEPLYLRPSAAEEQWDRGR